MDPRDVVIRPLLTEKGTQLREDGNKYVFEVARVANKLQIKEAVESLFDVRVAKVATMNRLGKTKRVRYRLGRKASWKKAVVTLRDGESLDFLEGA